MAVAFVLFRVFDIVKPPPIRQLDAAMKNGLGVMLDDLLAAGYALLVFALGLRMFG
jgi:phosphatidylglycerophosphatase A